MKNDDGIKLVEVNPRFAGTTSFIVGAGIHYVELAMKIFKNEKIHSVNI